MNPQQKDPAMWKEWANSSDENLQLYQDARDLVLQFYSPLSPEEFESEAIEFRRRINVTNTEKNDIVSLYDQRRPKKTSFLKYAAALLILLSAAITYFFVKDQRSSDMLTLSDDEVVISKSTTRGQKMTIVFPEGTVVKLNSESSITYPKEFNSDKREIILEGEAYFDVAHYENWPFIVRSKDVQTKVLGTAFNISSYPENEFVNIALVNGSVLVATKDQRTVRLQPMEMVSVHDNKEDLVIEGFDFEKIAGWKDNLIAFDKATFKEIESKLERWYDVEFDYTKAPVFEGGYTGDFSDESLESILEGISSNKFDYKIEGKRVLIM